MRTHLLPVVTALGIAAISVACSGRTTRASDRRAEHGLRGVNERVALRGCVQPAPYGEGYSLQHVIVLSSADEPSGLDAIEHPLIARGSWVRLAGGQDATRDLKSQLNHEVAVTGDIVEAGQNTVGTAGHSAPPNAPQASVANGDAPRVAVERIDKIADNCAGE